MTLLRSSQDGEDEGVVDGKRWRMMGKAEREGEGKTQSLPSRRSLKRHTRVETMHINPQPAIVILSEQQYLITA